jgi:hypothetical protein
MACQSNQLGGIVSGPRETLNAGKVSLGMPQSLIIANIITFDL